MIRSQVEEILDRDLNINEEINNKNYESLKGHFYRIVSSQNGSRIIQKCLAKTAYEFKIKIFNEVSTVSYT